MVRAMTSSLFCVSLLFVGIICVSGQSSIIETFNGQVIRAKKNPNVEGSQYLGSGNWFLGTCIAPNGTKFTDISMRYDSYEGLLEIKKDDGIIAVDRNYLGAFEYFTIAKSGDTLFYKFKTFKSLDGKPGTEYLQVLTDSEKIKLLVRRKVVMKEVSPTSYGGGSHQQFLKDDETFISVNNKVEVVRRNQKFFLAMFPALNDDIKKFLKANDSNLNNDKDLAALCLFLSSRI
jgi:hypothetical protein